MPQSDRASRLEHRARLAARARQAGGVLAVLSLVGVAFVEMRAGSTVDLVAHITVVLSVCAMVFATSNYSRIASVRAEHAARIDAEELARRDGLSGLYNARHLRERLHAETAEASRNGGNFALVLFDLDNFKDVNDRLGHLAGDALIGAIGASITAHVGERDIAARQGGDEFALLLRDCDRTRAETEAAEVVGRIEKAAVATTDHLPVSASFGVAVFPDDGADAESLTARADRELYSAKAAMLEAHERTAERKSQDVFFAIGEAIGQSLDPQQVVRNICRAVGSTLDIDACAIWLLQENDDLRPRAYYTPRPDLVERFAEVLSAQPIKRSEAVATGLWRPHPIYIDDIHCSDVLPQRFGALMDAGTWLINVPLPTAQGGILMLAAQHQRCAPPSTGLALAIAQAAGAAIENSDQYQRARKQGERLSQLAGLGGLLFGDGGYEDRLDRVTSRIIEITGFHMVTLDTSDPTGEQPFYRSFAGRSPHGGEYDERTEAMWRSMKPAISEPAVAEFLAKAAEPMIMDDPPNQVPAFYRDAIIESGTRTVVVMPIQWQGELNGLLYFASYNANAFDDTDVALMQTIAAQLAASIQVASLHVELEHSYGELKDAHLQALLRLAYAAEARDPYTECHLQRIRAIAQAVATRMGMEGEALEQLGYGAIVHDLGKLRIPDSILINPGALSDDEWAQMKQHPAWGAEIIGDNAFYDVARQVALNHHERWDGSGYPRGLKGDEIPLAARIVSIADVYDALTSARPYKGAWPAERALVELMRMRGRTLCPTAVDVFMDLWREGEIARIDEATADDSMEFDFRALYAA